MCFSAVLAIDMAVLLLDMLFSRDSLGNQLAASAVVILLAAVMAEGADGTRYFAAALRQCSLPTPLTGWEVLIGTLGMDVGYDAVVWVGYVLIVSIAGYGEERQILYSHTGHWHGCAGGLPGWRIRRLFLFPSSVCLLCW